MQFETSLRKLKITRDSGANLKLLRRLEQNGDIEIHDVMLESGRENRKTKKKIFPVAVFGHARFGESVFAGADNPYNELRNILGQANIEDAMQLEAHIRSKHDYFVTEDNDFLGKRLVLKERFGVEIVTPQELEQICQQ